MTVLTIRAHKRYAIRQAVRLQKEKSRPAKGLMIELSTEGCRISNLGDAPFEIGEEVSVDLCGNRKLHGIVRWAHDGFAGIKLGTPLLGRELADLLNTGRERQDTLRYGT